MDSWLFQRKAFLKFWIFDSHALCCFVLKSLFVKIGFPQTTEQGTPETWAGAVTVKYDVFDEGERLTHN